MTGSKFATAINCIDGRIQMPVIFWIMKKFGVDYVDTITAAGPEKLLAEGINQASIDSMRNCLEISMTRHGSKLVVVSAHFNCAGNPVEKELQLQQLRAAVTTVKSWQPDIAVAGVWVNEEWQVEPVSIDDGINP